MVDDAVLKQIYIKDNISDDIKNIISIPSPVISPTTQKTEFNLSVNNTIINISPVKRDYYVDKELRGKKSASGKVAKHEFLILSPSYRGGRGKAIHNNEYKIYKELELFDEIQVDAAWSGIIAWRRIGLQYAGKDTESNIIKIFLIPYSLEIKKLNSENLKTVMAEVKNKGLKTIDIEHLQYRLQFDEILKIFPSIPTEIKQHYKVLYDIDSSAVDFNPSDEVNFHLSDYIRFQALHYKSLKEYQTVAMYRKVS